MWHSGFRLPAKKCDTSTNIKDNIAHSISGFGVIVYQGAGGCSQFSDFKGYKNGLATVQMAVSGKNLATDIVSVDSAIGIHVGGSSGSPVELSNNIIYGSQDMQNSDCPLSSTGKCGCVSRKGVINPTFGGGPVEMKNDLKIKKMFSGGGGWGGQSLFIDNKFIGFDSK